MGIRVLSLGLLASFGIAASGASSLLAGAAAQIEAPSGRLVEARTAAVFAGACHYGGQRTTQGREAVLAWSFESGSYAGAELKGARAVALIRSDRNLADPGPRQSILILDAAMPATQRDALRKLLTERYAVQLGESSVRSERIEMRFDDKGGYTIQVAEGFELTGNSLPDKACCAMPFNVWYEPLVPMQGRIVSQHSLFRLREPALKLDFKRMDENNGFSGRFAFTGN